MPAHTPDWVKDSVFYQIFPDRFARSNGSKAPAGIDFKPWSTPPEEQGYRGGDLLGIVDKLDYLQDLGITALYLNPIFASASNHRYHTYDYMTVDPLLGGDDAFRKLLDAAHDRDMRVVVDGVFNHASRGFWAFHHILEEGGNSPYLDWFIVEEWPLRPYQHDADNPHNYAAWWGLPALPKFNIDNPGVRDYLFNVAKHWIDFGADGWRLDVPLEIEDVSFWQEFRRVVKGANPDAYILAEIWHDTPEWLQGDCFDAVMNYSFNRAALGFFGRETLRTDYEPGGFKLDKLSTTQFSHAVDRMLNLYDREVVLAQLNLMDSHDTARTLWTVDGDESALRLCTLFQMTMPGAPCIYYGDEIGMTGDHDPGCRGSFPWQDRDVWNTDLLDFHRHAIEMRHRYPSLRTGRFETVYAAGGIYAFRRHIDTSVDTDNDNDSGREDAIVVFNINNAPATVELPVDEVDLEGGIFEAVWGSGAGQVVDGKIAELKVPPRDALVLISRT